MITETDVVSVMPEAWLETCAAVAERGLTVVDWLTAIDREAGLDVVVALVNPGTPDCALVSCRVDSGNPSLPSLGSMFPGVDWHERETAEMFGIEFTGRDSTERKLLRNSDQAPLRKSSPLRARVQTAWPGADSDAGRRRRKLPPGVRPEWVDESE
jgi:NADH-quinone oxidoreductase subunit C